MSKITISFTGTSPTAGQQVQVTVERDIQPDLSDTERAELVKRELAVLQQAVQGEIAGQAPQASYSGGQSAGSGSGPQASTKQVNYLIALSKRLGIALDELNSQASTNYGAANIYDLTKRDASKFIDQLNGRAQNSDQRAA